jgi:broad specificity phosphatase PhoE
MLDHNEFYLSLIRHGESERNVIPDMMGQPGETPLTLKGEGQALKLGRRLEGFDHVFVSDYKRAHDTAKLALGEDYPMIETPALREYDAGDWTSASRTKELTPEVKIRMGSLSSVFCPPNGESMHMVERRASQWLEDAVIYNKSMIEETKKRAGVPLEIACFTHGMTIKCLLHYVMGFDQNFTWKIVIENTSISKLHFGKDGWRLLSVNDHAHLLG